MTEAPAGRKILCAGLEAQEVVTFGGRKKGGGRSAYQKLSAKASSECADVQDDFEEAA